MKLDKKKSLHYLKVSLVLGGIASISALLIAVSYMICQPIIEENEYISIDPSEEIEPEDGFFIIPFKFKKSFEEIYADLPHDSNLTLKVTCSKDEDSKLIDITGGSSVDLALVVKPEPRATISWKVMDEDED